ncbi:MAG: gliding motility-associated C-terminal domain-containing protein [Bacteroidia bacterium]|nr:gliding motility-associated C-terminal domain-containing protein [Bacteroidia bacterium]
MRNITLLICILCLSLPAWGQALVDSCFSTGTPGTTFANTAALGSIDGDLLSFNGTSWTGGFATANITLPPPNNNNCRAIWIGSGTLWTTGGEGFALKLTSPLLTGVSYSFSFTYVSHGTGSNGSFAPSFQTNTAPNLAGAFNVGNLPAVGNAWTSNTITFTASAAQNGDDWLVIHTGPTGSSGMFLSFCPGCAIPASCSVNLGPDTVLCAGGSLLLDATYPGANYLWSDNSTSNTLSVNSTGTFWAQINVNGCIVRDSINVTFNPAPVVNLGNDTAICTGTSLLLNPQVSGATYLWQNNSTGATFSANAAGLYWVEVDNGVCTARDSITLSLDPLPQVNLGNDTTICSGDVIVLDATFPNSNYEWSNSSFGPTLAVSTAGLYWVQTLHKCGIARDSIQVSTTSVPTINLGRDTTICQGNNLLLNATAPGVTYLWQNLSTSPTFNVTTAGLYSVTLNHLCGTFSDSIRVVVDSIPRTELGANRQACEGDVILLNASAPGNTTYLWQDNSTNPFYTITTGGLYSVILSGRCGSSRDSVNVTYFTYPTVDLGADTVLCKGTNLQLSAFYPGATYLWQNNSTASSFVANGPGIYSVIVTNGVCPASDNITITGDSIPPLNLGPDRFLCDGETAVLDATVPGNVTYVWQDSTRFSTYPIQRSGTYYVDVRNQCGRIRDSVVVRTSITPVVNLGISEVICSEGNGFTVRDVSISAPDAIYLWSDGSTDPVKVIEQTGVYRVRIETGCGVDEDSIWVGFSVYPKAEIGNDTILCEEDFPIVLRAEERPGDYRWQDGSGGTSYTVSEPGLYALEVTNNCGTDRDSMIIEMRSCRCNVFVPTGFTPNGDGVNELMTVGYQCGFEVYSLHIYNRWGQEVFVSSNPDEAWDGRTGGRSNPEGVYIWVLRYQYAARGWSIPNTETGTITIVR